MDTFSKDIALFTTRFYILQPLRIGVFLSIFLIVPFSLLFYFATNFSFFATGFFFLLCETLLFSYLFSQWTNSFFTLTNQKISFSIWHGIFSHTFANIPYESLEECQYTKENFLFWKYGILTLITREKKVHTLPYIQRGKEISSLIQILVEYPPDVRADFRNIRKVHEYHMRKK